MLEAFGTIGIIAVGVALGEVLKGFIVSTIYVVGVRRAQKRNTGLLEEMEATYARQMQEELEAVGGTSEPAE